MCHESATLLTLQAAILPLEIAEKFLGRALAICTGRVQLTVAVALEYFKDFGGLFYRVDVRSTPRT